MKDLIEEIEGRPAPASPLDAEIGMGYDLDAVAHGRARVETDFPLPPIGRRLKFSPEDIVLPEPYGFGEEPAFLDDAYGFATDAEIEGDVLIISEVETFDDGDIVSVETRTTID